LDRLPPRLERFRHKESGPTRVLEHNSGISLALAANSLTKANTVKGFSRVIVGYQLAWFANSESVRVLAERDLSKLSMCPKKTVSYFCAVPIEFHDEVVLVVK
jgi:hypothetical protein